MTDNTMTTENETCGDLISLNQSMRGYAYTVLYYLSHSATQFVLVVV